MLSAWMHLCGSDTLNRHKSIIIALCKRKKTSTDLKKYLVCFEGSPGMSDLHLLFGISGLSLPFSVFSPVFLALSVLLNFC